MNKKVFLIDDDLDDRELFCEAMEEVSPDIICYTAANCRTALTQITNKEIAIPDIIFLDINMPIMNGWQCLSMLKEQELYKNIPVIMYSTSSHLEDVEKAEQLGALCFFTKPRDFKTLKKSLEIVVEHLHSNSLFSVIHNSPLFVAPQPTNLG